MQKRRNIGSIDTYISIIAGNNNFGGKKFMVMDKKTQYFEEIRILRRQITDLEKIKEEYEQTLPKLKESEKQYRLLAENTLDWVFWLAPDDRLVYISPSCKRITGYETEEFIKDPKLLFKIIHPEDRSNFDDHRRFMHKAKAHGEEEFRILCKDGKTRWISHACHAVYDDDGQYAGILSSNCDTTDRRQVEDKLNAIDQQAQKSNSQMKALMNAVTESFFVMDIDSHVLFANETTAKRLGTDLDSLIKKQKMYDLLPPDVAASRKKYLADVQKTGRPVRFEDERFERTILNSVYPIENEDGRITQFAVFGMDITDRKASEAAIAESQRKLDEANRMLRQVIDTIPMRIFWKDKRSSYLGCNRLFAQDAGREKPEELIGDSDQNMIWRDQADHYRQDDLDVMAGVNEKINEEESHITPDGKTIWLRSTKVPLTDMNGRVIGVLGTYEDITAQKHATEALAESETRYRTLFENNHMPMLLIDPDTSAIMDANPAASAYYGWTRDELVRKQISDINTLTPDELATEMKQARAQKRNHFLFKHRLADGDVRDVEVFSGPLKFRGKTLLYSTINDITDRVRKDTVSRRSEKLDSLGILAGGLAHDFNNLMTVVQGQMDVALFDLPKDHPARSALDAAQQTVDKTKEITGRLLTFSRGGDPILKTIRIENFLDGAIKNALDGSPVDVAYELPKDLWPVAADENQISQCLCNLAENAGDAMPDGGALNIAVENVEVKAKDALPLPEGPYVRLTFEDTGNGISAENLPRIFDPYFTTKPLGKNKGMGLGLAVCYSVLKKHGGYIAVASEEGQGSSFSLYLPARPVSTSREKPADATPTGTHRKRILVMDDNEPIRKLLQLYIEQLGYDVTTVAEGQQALAEYSRALDESKAYRAVILEVSVRQGWGGDVALMKLQKINPDIKAVAIISEEDDLRQDDYKACGFQNVLSKPFRLEHVRHILEDILKS
jgi:PAS domain S-box-containing protein